MESQQLILKNSVPEPNTGCWLWTGANHNKLLYGATGRRKLAHRVSYEAFNGPIAKGLHVLHQCDTPACVNPNHLSLGTHLDNMKDMAAKKRYRIPNNKGERNGQTKLTRQSVEEIRRTYVRGTNSVPVFAKKFGVSESCIYDALKGRRWK